MVDEYKAYKCSNCGISYGDDEDQAIYCCPNVEQVWACNDCNTEYILHRDAVNCCSEEDEESEDDTK